MFLSPNLPKSEIHKFPISLVLKCVVGCSLANTCVRGDELGYMLYGSEVLCKLTLPG